MRTSSVVPMPGTSQFDPPLVVALFPSYAVLCWAHPRTNGSKPFAEHTSWDYRVEYTCSCRTRRQPYAVSTSDTHVLIATPHSRETYYVRLVAHARFAGAMAGLVSAKMSFVAKSTMTIPWSAVDPSPCIFDGLYLCAAVRHDKPAAAAAAFTAVRRSRQTPRQHRCMLENNLSFFILDGGAEFWLVRATYDSAVPPAHKRAVFYMVATGRRERSGQRLRSKEMESLLLRDDAALIFSGVGENGRHAVRATHMLLSSFMTSCPALSSSIFCITFGTPRVFLKDGAQLLAHTLPRSNQFLHVTQLPLWDGVPADASAASATYPSLEDDAVVMPNCTSGAAFSPLRLTGYAEGFYRNSLLGVQCRVVAAHQTGSEIVALELHAPRPTSPLTAAETGEVFDVDEGLHQLAHLFFPGSPLWLAPAVTSLRCRTAGALLHVTVEGTNLQYTPRLTLLAPRHVPAYPYVMDCTPQRLTCVASLLPWIEEVCLAARVENGEQLCLDEVPLSVLVQTSFGTCAGATKPGGVTLPVDLVELYQSSIAELPMPWATAAPAALIGCALHIQPLYALCRNPSSVAGGDDMAPNPLAEVLCSIASASETAEAEKTRTAPAGGRGSVFAFMSDVAARFSSAVSGTTTEGASKLPVSWKEAAFLRNAMKEWASGSSAGIDVWRLRSASWMQRVLHAVPALSVALYRPSLARLLCRFDAHAAADEAAPYLWLEARLYTNVRLHVCQRLATSLDLEDLLCSTVTLSDFYTAVLDVFVSESSALVNPSTAFPWVEDAMLLWCLCLCFELRREMSRIFLCCVVGCAGCGGATLSAALATQLLQTAGAPGYSPSLLPRRTLVCRLPTAQLSALFLAMQSGVRLAVFLAGEVADLARSQYATMSMQIQENLVYRHQHWFLVITKADEQLRHTHTLKEGAATQTCAAAVLSQLTTEVLGGSVADEHRLVVSLAPSPTLLTQVFKCSQDEADHFAAELRAASQSALLHCLLLCVGKAGGPALL